MDSARYIDTVMHICITTKKKRTSISEQVGVGTRRDFREGS